LSDLNKALIFLTDSQKIMKHHISLKSFQWKSCCFLQTDRQTDRQTWN